MNIRKNICFENVSKILKLNLPFSHIDAAQWWKKNVRMKFNYPAPPQHQTASTAKIISRTMLATIKQPAKPVKQRKKKSVLRCKCNAYMVPYLNPHSHQHIQQKHCQEHRDWRLYVHHRLLRFWRQTVPLLPKQSAGKLHLCLIGSWTPHC